MNYIKKIKSIGFRKAKHPLVIYEVNDYGNNILYSEIKELNEFIMEMTVKNKRNLTQPIRIYEMGITLTKETIDSLSTYAWKVNKNLTIYLTIQNQGFTCFGEDTEAPPIITDGFISPHIEKKDKFFIMQHGKLCETFWKDIVNAMPLKYKREILLNQII